MLKLNTSFAVPGHVSNPTKRPRRSPEQALPMDTFTVCLSFLCLKELHQTARTNKWFLKACAKKKSTTTSFNATIYNDDDERCLMSTIALMSCPNLTKVTLGSVLRLDTITMFSSACRKLRVFHASVKLLPNTLQAIIIPLVARNLPNLEHLQLTSFRVPNHLSMLPFAVNTPHLQSLKITNFKWGATRLPVVGVQQLFQKCTRLQELFFAGISSDLYSALENVGQLWNMHELVLLAIDATDRLCSLIARVCPNLKELSFAHNEMVTDKGILTLKRLDLTGLYIWDTLATPAITDVLCERNVFPNLVTLCIGDNFSSAKERLQAAKPGLCIDLDGENNDF